jgi:hypothetical protein
MIREAPPFVWSDGARVAGTSIWCDAARTRELCFVSHAVVPLPKKLTNQRLLATTRTVQLRQALGAALGTEVLTTPYCRPFALGRARLQLLPAGFLPGSAQLHIELPRRSLLYAGAIGTSVALEPDTVEPLQTRAAECVVFDAPLAPYLSPLPPRTEVESHLLSALENHVSRDHAVLLWVPLIDSEEVTRVVVRAGMRVRLHPEIAALLSTYKKLGISTLHPCPPALRGAPKGGEVLVWPFEKYSQRTWHEAGVIPFLVSGQALEVGTAERFGVERAFARSRHADLPSLVIYALSAGAKLVFLVRGFTQAVARVFAERGLEARPLGPPAQMSLFRGTAGFNP